MFWSVGHAPCVWHGEAGGAKGVKNGQVAYKIDTDDEWNRMQVNFSPYGQPGELRVRSKGGISLNFNHKIKFNDCTKLCVCSHKYTIKHIKRNYHCVLGHAPGVVLGVLGVKNLSFWDLRCRPSTRGSSYILHIRVNMHGVQVYLRNPYPWSLQISTL